MSLRYPWPSYSGSWGCDLAGFQVDGFPHEELVNSEQRRIRADEVDDWDAVSCTFLTLTTENTPEGLTNVEPFILASSPRTQLRRTMRMAETSMSAGYTEYSGHVELPRSLLAGAVTIQLGVAATFRDRRRVVGGSEPWSLIVEPSEAPRPPGSPPFKTSWVDFSSAEAPSDCRQSPTTHALMDLTGSDPVLFLNSGLDGFSSLLLAENARLERRRHQDLLGVDIARYSLATLFRAAANEISGIEDDDPVEPPSTSLLRRVCEGVAGTMPGVDSTEDLYERVSHAHKLSPPLQTSLWTEIDLAIDQFTDVPKTVARICAEVKHA